MDIVTAPGESPEGTSAVTSESETTVNVAAFTVPNFTVVAWIKPEPLIVTSVPIGPLGGEKVVIFGLTLKVCGLVRVVEPVVTVTAPVCAPVGTTAVR